MNLIGIELKTWYVLVKYYDQDITLTCSNYLQ